MRFVNRLRHLHGKIEEKRLEQKKAMSLKNREKRNEIELHQLKNRDFTIISNTCIGGVICHDLDIPFQSPTVNIYIRPVDFVKFCSNLQFYIQQPLTEMPYNPAIGYPVATIHNEITLYCKHYSCFKEVEEAWQRRIQRINWKHLCVMMTDRDFIPPFCTSQPANYCGEDVLKKFEMLPYEHKVCHVKNAEHSKRYSSCCQITRGCDMECVGIITDIISTDGKRMYQFAKDWDYIDFLNEV